MNRTFPWISCFLLCLIPPLAHGTQDDPGLELCRKTLARVSARYQSLETLSARFVHTLNAPALDQREEETGTLRLRRGGYARWDYDTPEGKLAWSDGKEAYLYLPQERQVLIRPMDDSLPVRLLMGGADPAEVADCRGAFELEGEVHLTLALREPESGIGEITLKVDQSRSVITHLEYGDALGNRISFALSEIQLNPALKQDLFSIPIPDGAKIYRDLPSTN